MCTCPNVLTPFPRRQVRFPEPVCILSYRDKADEGRTVETQGMDGFLGVIQSAMAKKKEQVEEAPETDAQVPQDPTALPRATESSFEAEMAKKARLKMEKRMAEMDRYERKRFELEHGLLQPAPAPREEDTGAGPEQSGSQGEAGTSKGLGQTSVGAEDKSKTVPEEAPARKRTAEDKIEAARARAKARRMKK